MEILSETVFTGEYFFTVILGFLVTLVVSIFTLGLTYYSISDRDGIGLVITIFMFSFSILIGWCTYNDVRTGPKIEYTAKVTDYNEVYAQGYKIIRHEGKLAILTKE